SLRRRERGTRSKRFSMRRLCMVSGLFASTQCGLKRQKNVSSRMMEPPFEHLFTLDASIFMGFYCFDLVYALSPPASSLLKVLTVIFFLIFPQWIASSPTLQSFFTI